MICFVVFVSSFYFSSLFSALSVTSAAVVWDVMAKTNTKLYSYSDNPKPTQPINKVNGPLTFYQQHSHNASSVSESA